MGTIIHYGTKRHSGRYPWGSGGDDSGSETLNTIERLTEKGLSEKEIADGLDMSTTELRNQKALLVGERKEAQRLHVIKEKERGLSVAAISSDTGLPESTVRDMLKPAANMKYRIVRDIADKLKSLIGRGDYLDVGEGVELYMNTTRTKLNNAIQLLKNEGYKLHYIKQEQLGTNGKQTWLKVLSDPDTEYTDVANNRSNIKIPNTKSVDGGEMVLLPDEVKNISSKRVLVKYADDGGADKDGLIELRRGVPELNLGNKAYAQVRIGVDGTHYMKGMAVTRDDLPDGVDIIYNTSKKPTGNKLDAMKEQKERAVGNVSVFGAVVSPNTYEKNGKIEFGVINKVGDEGNPSEEGTWADWNSTLASQVLSKQSPILAKRQLSVVSDNYKAELDDISSPTNPTVREHLLIEFADKADRAAVDLKAAAMPRQSTNVLLPDPKLKPGDIYAPNYNNGEPVSLIRYPHGGVFEIPTLTVNNKNSQYRKIIGTSPADAVAIHPSVAQKLSGADFDGDFVLVVPNKRKELRTAPSLDGLKDFDPIRAYPKYDGMKVMSEKQKQREMGNVSNLITDMTIRGANQDEIARAVRHSMVVIDAAKHELNYKQSYRDNAIAALKERYQGGARRGASTLISKTKSEERVDARRDHYTIDPKTGKKVWTYTEETYIDKRTGKTVKRTTKSTKGAEYDAFDLASKPITPIERVYAEHANRMKELGNKARLATLKQEPTPYSRQARITYQTEVDSLDRKLKNAIRARPLERKAQILGGEIYKSKLAANPGMSYVDKRKAKGQALKLARVRLESSKPTIDITPREWHAIELGAVSPTRLKQILRNADMDLVREYATPRAIKGGLSTAKTTRAKALLKSGYTTAEIASALGVSVSAIRNIDKD